jgi:hypothetical protein
MRETQRSWRSSHSEWKRPAILQDTTGSRVIQALHKPQQCSLALAGHTTAPPVEVMVNFVALSRVDVSVAFVGPTPGCTRVFT